MPTAPSLDAFRQRGSTKKRPPCQVCEALKAVENPKWREVFSAGLLSEHENERRGARLHLADDYKVKFSGAAMAAHRLRKGQCHA